MAPFSLNVQIQGHGFPILCLHGHPGSSQCMSVFTDHLSQQFQTISPDLRGYGKSPTRHPFDITDHLLDLQHLLNKLQIDQFLILGWSLGGILALELALRFPTRVTGLILVASAARPRSNHPPLHWQNYLYTGIAGTLNLVFPGWQWNINTFGTRSLLRYLIHQQTPTAYHYLATQGTPAYLQTTPAATRALTRALKQGYNREPDLAQIQCPTLLLAGAEDCHITAASSLATAQRLPRAIWHCYPQAAHLFPWEIPHQVLSDIDHWLTTHPQIIPVGQTL